MTVVLFGNKKNPYKQIVDITIPTSEHMNFNGEEVSYRLLHHDGIEVKPREEFEDRFFNLPMNIEWFIHELDKDFNNYIRRSYVFNDNYQFSLFHEDHTSEQYVGYKIYRSVTEENNKIKKPVATIYTTMKIVEDKNEDEVFRNYFHKHQYIFTLLAEEVFVPDEKNFLLYYMQSKNWSIRTHDEDLINERTLSDELIEGLTLGEGIRKIIKTCESGVSMK